MDEVLKVRQRLKGFNRPKGRNFRKIQADFWSKIMYSRRIVFDIPLIGLLSILT